MRVRAVVTLERMKFKEAADTGSRAMTSIVKNTGRDILLDIKGGGPNAAPIRTGRLRRAYKMQVSHRGRRVLVYADRGIAYHAPFVEFGTYKMAAQPHFRPAVAAGRRRAKSQAVSHLRKDMARYR